MSRYRRVWRGSQLPRIPQTPLLVVALALYVVGLYLALIWAPVELTLGESYRVFYLHVPAAWVSYLALGLSLIGSIAYLRTRNTKYDTLAERSIIPAIYNIFAFSTVPLSYISVVYWQTLHPRIIEQTSQGLTLAITPEMIVTLMVNLVAATILFIFLADVLYRLRRSERILEEYEELTWR
jgi:ABC-type transport system involved in cytochrome c biogenesis permease subunit